MDELSNAAERGDIDYLDHHVGPHNIQCVSNNSLKILMNAIYRNHYDVVKLLLHKGVPVDVPIGFWGHTPLMLTIVNGQDDMVQLLCSHHANINHRIIEGGRTPMIFAARNGRWKSMQILLAHGADINRRDAYGDSPLQHAVYVGQYHAAELLIAMGASREVLIHHSVNPEIRDLLDRPLPLQTMCQWKLQCESSLSDLLTQSS